MTGANKKVLILGTGRFAPVVADIISEVPGYTVCGFIENMDPAKCQETIEGYPIHWIEDVGSLADDHMAICCLGTTTRRKIIEQAKEVGFSFATIVHPTSRVSKKSTLGKGCLIGPGVMISSGTHLADHVRVNRGVLIGHDVTIEEYATIQPGANIASSCHIERCVYIGMSATIIDSLRIAESSVVGAGAVVTKDVPSRVMVLGVPAKIVKEDIEDF